MFESGRLSTGLLLSRASSAAGVPRSRTAALTGTGQARLLCLVVPSPSPEAPARAAGGERDGGSPGAAHCPSPEGTLVLLPPSSHRPELVTGPCRRGRGQEAAQEATGVPATWVLSASLGLERPSVDYSRQEILRSRFETAGEGVDSMGMEKGRGVRKYGAERRAEGLGDQP